jgi:hypothetical protein
MNARYEEGYYRNLLEAAQKGIEDCKAFLEAIGKSEAALTNPAVYRMTESTMTCLKQLEDEADQLWDQFKPVLRGDCTQGAPPWS